MAKPYKMMVSFRPQNRPFGPNQFSERNYTSCGPEESPKKDPILVQNGWKTTPRAPLEKIHKKTYFFFMENFLRKFSYKEKIQWFERSENLEDTISKMPPAFLITRKERGRHKIVTKRSEVTILCRPLIRTTEGSENQELWKERTKKEKKP